MQFIRTPDSRFENLPGYNFEPHYFETNGLRIHYLYRKMVPILAKRGRVLAPFNKAFRERKGMTPTEFRRKAVSDMPRG